MQLSKILRIRFMKTVSTISKPNLSSVNHEAFKWVDKSLQRPGIEPGPPAWQARILPLNQRCLLFIPVNKIHIIFAFAYILKVEIDVNSETEKTCKGNVYDVRRRDKSYLILKF